MISEVQINTCPADKILLYSYCHHDS